MTIVDNRVGGESEVGMLPSAPAGLPSSSAPGKPVVVPTPVSNSSTTVTYLSDDDKAKLFAKYGKIQPPKAADVVEVAGAGCKMQ